MTFAVGRRRTVHGRRGEIPALPCRRHLHGDCAPPASLCGSMAVAWGAFFQTLPLGLELGWSHFAGVVLCSCSTGTPSGAGAAKTSRRSSLSFCKTELQKNMFLRRRGHHPHRTAITCEGEEFSDKASVCLWLLFVIPGRVQLADGDEQDGTEKLWRCLATKLVARILCDQDTRTPQLIQAELLPPPPPHERKVISWSLPRGVFSAVLLQRLELQCVKQFLAHCSPKIRRVHVCLQLGLSFTQPPSSSISALTL